MEKPVLYPKPGATGGTLVREVISFLRKSDSEISLPFGTGILIAVSGGSDSTALAHLIVHYGRKIVARDKIRLLHINHQWRKGESDEDAFFVESLGRQWNVPVIVHRATPPSLRSKQGESWENHARKIRKKIFLSEAQKWDSQVLTAHHSDDLVETLLWRLFTGAPERLRGGILFRHRAEVRPFLRVRKSVLIRYLSEEGVIYREDSTNSSTRFLRVRMRQGLMKEIESIFPKAIQNLASMALQFQFQARSEFLRKSFSEDDILGKRRE